MTKHRLTLEQQADNYTATVSRYEKLNKYYRGDHDILQRSMTDGKPNNRIVNPYPKYITDMYVGYMVGVPITYNAPDTAQEQLQTIQDIFNYNDEASHNSELSRDMSIYGIAAELLYTDEDAEIRFARLDPREIIPIYSTWKSYYNRIICDRCRIMCNW